MRDNISRVGMLGVQTTARLVFGFLSLRVRTVHPLLHKK